MLIDNNSALELSNVLQDFCDVLNNAHHDGLPQVRVEVIHDALKEHGIISEIESEQIKGALTGMQLFKGDQQPKHNLIFGKPGKGKNVDELRVKHLMSDANMSEKEARKVIENN